MIDSYSWYNHQKKAPLGATKGNKSHDQQQNVMPIIHFNDSDHAGAKPPLKSVIRGARCVMGKNQYGATIQKKPTCSGN